MKKNILILITLTFLISACTTSTKVDTVTTNTTKEESTSSITTPKDNQKIKYDTTAALKDVSGGSATGTAYSTFTEKEYILKATFNDLPELNKEKFFYEGWVVRKSPLNVISTGAVSYENGQISNSFSSSDDLLDHISYILTIEPTDDGEDGQPDPAPADHILEGQFVNPL